MLRSFKCELCFKNALEAFQHSCGTLGVPLEFKSHQRQAVYRVLKRLRIVLDRGPAGWAVWPGPVSPFPRG